MEGVTIIKGRYIEKMTEEEFFEFCQANRDLQIERNPCRQIVVESPAGTYTGKWNSEISFQLTRWNHEKGLGEVFDSSTGFRLPDGSIRSPDAAWLSNAKWAAVPEEKRYGFAPVCPDFVIELRSPGDAPAGLKSKMQIWIANGCRLAWLIDPEEAMVFIYRPDGTVEEHLGFDRPVPGENVLPGFELDLGFLLR